MTRRRLTTKQATYEKYVTIAKGEPENFLGADEFQAKFDSLAEPYLDGSRRRRNRRVLLSLETAADVGAILRLTRSPKGPIAGRSRRTLRRSP